MNHPAPPLTPGGDGILNCFKPPGVSSRELVNWVARRVRPRKAGHAGTLDPLAEGVLVLPVGAATRLVPFIHLYPKSYHATFRFGQSSPSGDLETPLSVEHNPSIPTREEVEQAAEKLTGEITQVPPAHSAIKVRGRRAYKAAHRGHAIDVPPRRVTIHSIKIIDYQYPDLSAEICCSTGTYVRSIGIDWAKILGTTAVMTKLTRTAVGPYPIEDAIELTPSTLDHIDRYLLPMASAVGLLQKLTLDETEIEDIQHGRSIRKGWKPNESSPGQQWAAVDTQGQLRAILVPREDAWGPLRVFPATSQSV